MRNFRHSNFDKLLYVLLSYQNIAMFDIASSEGRKATTEIGVNIFMDLQSLITPDLSMEVGAREATFSLAMRRLFPNLPAVAFEGSPGAHAYHEKRHDYASKNISYLQCVIGDHAGVAEFHIIDEVGQSGSHIQGDNGRNSLNERKYSDFHDEVIQVESHKGDEFIDQYNAHNAVVWIDVEGAAKQVLFGLEKSLSLHRIAAIYIELESKVIWEDQWTSCDIINYLLSYDYIPIYRDSESTSQGNIIFIRSDLITGDVVTSISKNIHTYKDIFFKKIAEFDDRIKSVEHNMMEILTLIKKMGGGIQRIS